MKRGYSKLLYNQRNKSETIVSVIKRLFVPAYNTHRLTNITVIIDGFYVASSTITPNYDKEIFHDTL